MASQVRIALANLRFPDSPTVAVQLARDAVAKAAQEGAAIICFPECFLPGYRSAGRAMPPPDAAFLEAAWSDVAESAARVRLAVVMGTERLVDGNVVASTIVINADGSVAGFQDKVQIDPSEGGIYTPGTERNIFHAGPITFGVVICHEGWRYPETVRWAARRGAQVVFHSQFHEAEGNSYRPKEFADPANSFHEKALLCRAAENTCYVASVNYASDGSPTTSAIVNPDGTLLTYQPYGREGLLIGTLDLTKATGLLAQRYKPT